MIVGGNIYGYDQTLASAALFEADAAHYADAIAIGIVLIALICPAGRSGCCSSTAAASACASGRRHDRRQPGPCSRCERAVRAPRRARGRPGRQPAAARGRARGAARAQRRRQEHAARRAVGRARAGRRDDRATRPRGDRAAVRRPRAPQRAGERDARARVVGGAARPSAPARARDGAARRSAPGSSRGARRCRCRAASAGACTSPARSRSRRTCCCSTSRSPASTPQTRARLLEDSVSALRSQTRATLVVVHDRAEAWALADRLLDPDRRRAGRLPEPPRELLAAPPSARVARFLGFDGWLADGGGAAADAPRARDARPRRAAARTRHPRGAARGRVPPGARAGGSSRPALRRSRRCPAPAAGESVRVRVDGGARFPAQRPEPAWEQSGEELLEL